MMAIEDAGERYPQEFRRVLGRRAAEPGGDPLVPRAVRRDLLDYYGLTESYPLVANYPFLEVREGSMGSRCRAGTCGS